MSLVARRVAGGLLGCDQASCQRTLPGLWRVQSDPQYEPHLFVGQGWQPDANGVWSVSTYARRDSDFMAGRHGDARRHVRSHREVPPDTEAIGWLPDLPIRIVCPRCNAVQTVRADVLGVQATWRRQRQPCMERGCTSLSVPGGGYCDQHAAAHPEWVELPLIEYAPAAWRVRDEARRCGRAPW